MATNTPLNNWLEPLTSLETTNSFIITIRSNPGKSLDKLFEWHGSAEHAQSRQRIYFIDYARLNAFIAARSETAVLPPWPTRLSRRWRSTRLYHWLQPRHNAPLAGA